MPLRPISEQITVEQCLSALGNVMFYDSTTRQPNTNLAINQGTVTINDDGPLLLDTARWPACLIEEGPAPAVRIGPRHWQRKLTVLIWLMDRYDQNNNDTNSAIWTALRADVDRVVANLADNPTLTWNGTRNALNVVHVEPSPRNQKAVDKESYGVPVVQTIITLLINLPPWASVN